MRIRLHSLGGIAADCVDWRLALVGVYRENISAVPVEGEARLLIAEDAVSGEWAAIHDGTGLSDPTEGGQRGDDSTV